VAIIAVFNVKGGVGKTTLAVNLAWVSAVRSARKTLLWDLDPQGGATFLLGADTPERKRASQLFSRDLEPEKLLKPSAVPGLDLLPADESLRALDQMFLTIGKKRRLARLTETLAQRYDRIILDCPPAINETSDQVMRAATLIVVPVTPSALSRRALDEVRDHLFRHHKGHPPILPVLSMVDGRRSLHKQAMADQPDWPVVPMASAVEQMGEKRLPLGAYAPNCPAAQACGQLWAGIERKLAKG
jgi:chromosome partitioning protein